jgi:integrase
MDAQEQIKEVTTSSPRLPTPMVESARRYISQAKAENTIRAYRSDWQCFSTWCASKELQSLPARPESIACFIAETADAGAKVSTISRRLAAISKAHEAVGHESPCSMRHAVVSETFKGVRREHGTAQQGRAPLLTVHIRRILSALPDCLIGVRDRALVLLGFAGGFRRSELVMLKMEDLDFTDDGLVITVRRSKTDQEGAGRKVGIPYGSDPQTCPVRSLKRWFASAGITEGYVFRAIDRAGRIAATRLSPQAVRLVVQRRCKAAGLDVAKFSAHSLRSGLATQAAANGAPERAIMAQTGHRSVLMVRRYIRDGSLFRENAAASLGL